MWGVARRNVFAPLGIDGLRGGCMHVNAHRLVPYRQTFCHRVLTLEDVHVGAASSTAALGRL